MDLWRATLESGYFPFSDEFDRIVDADQLVTKERAIEIVKFLTDYRLGRIERPPMPTDHHEMLISRRKEQNEDELIAAIPRGTSRKHLFDFAREAKELESSLRDEFAHLGLSPAETSVTFVIENSGSTRGETAYHLTLSTIEMCKALDGLGVETAVLGYTSDSWKGGISARRWIAEGRPRNPGRLDDLQHVIFKRPGATMDALSIGRLHMLADPRLKRENILGEGLMWGASAAATSDRPTRLLIHVVNKPNSVSQATFQANDDGEGLFRRHHEAVIAEIDAGGVLAMSMVMLSPSEGTIKNTREARDKLGRMVVVAEGSGRADETLQAFRDGVTAAMERSLELRDEPAHSP